MTTTDQQDLLPFPAIAFDLYRDIHKGIRTELFAVTALAGSIDPSSPTDRAALAARIASLVLLLESHAGHEDSHVDPVVAQHLPALAESVNAEHQALESRLSAIEALAQATLEAEAHEQRSLNQRIYIELASFTSAYLAHQDLEERVVMPALFDAVGLEATIGIHVALIASIPPDEMAEALALMLPAINIDDRADMLGAMQADAPAEAFAAVWGLAGSVLEPSDLAALATRLGLP